MAYIKTRICKFYDVKCGINALFMYLKMILHEWKTFLHKCIYQNAFMCINDNKSSVISELPDKYCINELAIAYIDGRIGCYRLL